MGANEAKEGKSFIQLQAEDTCHEVQTKLHLRNEKHQSQCSLLENGVQNYMQESVKK